MKTRVLMVCLGNICRSPLAEGILKSKVDPEKVFVDSAGTGDWHVDSEPDKRSIAIASKNGLNISQQRGRQFSKKDFQDFDHIFVMDNSNFKDVIAMAATDEERQKVHLILEEIFPSENVDVPDPYHGGDQGFENVYMMLDEATDELKRKLESGEL
ncbi:low molecular weight protein-tyrosine-phosphatase [Christiangramia sp. OXR-203]|jgi:protein-tyrosine phosphatase|uniref:low molecular weight protein-tyrosine-phosphatase n=1 Tax=Christiangramia sp. OXR-203 TaxID=3100176 RepID=UPI002AC8EDC8|nr:low molecular weight protein-tyrosine-phosphatase [Christiangramia sp. OXR-203]WPY97849.1 low molecular weight protein-tyrosine-phosphatase [Christiangramia sp. OXR-203]